VPDDAIPDYPIAYDAGKAYLRSGRSPRSFGYGAQWAGQGAPLARTLSTRALMDALIAELGISKAAFIIASRMTIARVGERVLPHGRRRLTCGVLPLISVNQGAVMNRMLLSAFVALAVMPPPRAPRNPKANPRPSSSCMGICRRLVLEQGHPAAAGHRPALSFGAEPAEFAGRRCPATKRVLDAEPGPIVLVGHSWGGAVITEAGNHDKVKALVYVAAFAPSTQARQAPMAARTFPPPPGLAHPIASADGFLTCRLTRSRRTSRRTSARGSQPHRRSRKARSIRRRSTRRSEGRLVHATELVHRRQERPDDPTRGRTRLRQADQGDDDGTRQ
jgi:hypothetical protein